MFSLSKLLQELSLRLTNILTFGPYSSGVPVSWISLNEAWPTHKPDLIRYISVLRSGLTVNYSCWVSDALVCQYARGLYTDWWTIFNLLQGYQSRSQYSFSVLWSTQIFLLLYENYSSIKQFWILYEVPHPQLHNESGAPTAMSDVDARAHWGAIDKRPGRVFRRGHSACLKSTCVLRRLPKHGMLLELERDGEKKSTCNGKTLWKRYPRHTRHRSSVIPLASFWNWPYESVGSMHFLRNIGQWKNPTFCNISCESAN